MAGRVKVDRSVLGVGMNRERRRTYGEIRGTKEYFFDVLGDWGAH